MQRSKDLTDGFKLFLCGDVMTARGIDQILPNPGEPHPLDDGVSGRDVMAYTERSSGPIPRPASFDYVWGEALDIWEEENPLLRIANLETAITAAGHPDPLKPIRYRMHPENVWCLKAAKLDCCNLANNHALDWGVAGLRDTLDALRLAQISAVGAGNNKREAETATILPLNTTVRVIVVALGFASSGISASWQAGEGRPGINWSPRPSPWIAKRVGRALGGIRRSHDLVVASIHWGGNWGFSVSDGQRSFARQLVDLAGVDIVHGHSSHHVKGIEVYNDRLILYGCGDFLNDYEAMVPRPGFRQDLGLMYHPRLSPSGHLIGLEMTPTQIKRFRVSRAAREGVEWLADVLNREGRLLGTGVELTDAGKLKLIWEQAE